MHAMVILRVFLQLLVCRFFLSQQDYEEEKHLYSSPVLKPALPDAVDSSNGPDMQGKTKVFTSASGVDFPPFLVLERGTTLSGVTGISSQHASRQVTCAELVTLVTATAPCGCCLIACAITTRLGVNCGQNASLKSRHFLVLMAWHLAEWRRQERSFFEVSTMVESLARLLALLHQANYCHRDLKPSNALILMKDAKWKLLDLGIAKQTGTLR